jgi:hypothetical protein
MPVLEGYRIKIEMFDRHCALAFVPAISQQDSANIKKNHVEGEHRRLPVFLFCDEFLMKMFLVARRNRWTSPPSSGFF